MLVLVTVAIKLSIKLNNARRLKKDVTRGEIARIGADYRVETA